MSANRSRLSTALTTLLVGAAVTLTGCKALEDRPGGNMRTEDRYTYVSTAHAPVTVTIYDTRTNEILWQVDVPLNKKLTFKFYEGRSEDSELRPDLMRWSIYDDDHFRKGRLENAMSMPSADARMIVPSYGESPAFPEGYEPPAKVSSAGE